ncbi:hypothetical protein D9M73_165020 [compost metagenome]
MNVLDTDDAHEIDVAVMVIEGELHQPPNRLDGRQFSQVQPVFGIADIAVELLQHLDVELFLTAEVVIDHALGRVDALGDGIDASPGKPLLNELDNRLLQDVLAGFFRIVLATLARFGNRLIGCCGEF